jgi:O-antigen/teichoic acid export membrane protein
VDNDVSSKITRNSLFNLARTTLSLPIFLFTTIYILRTIGKEQFGIWALVGVISSYAQLSEFGITESLIKFTAEYHAGNDTRKLNELLNTSFALYLVLGLASCSLLLAGMGIIVDDILNIPRNYRPVAIQVYSLSIILFFVNMISGVYGSMLTGAQRMDYTNAILFSSSLINAIGTVLFLRMGYGLPGLVLTSAITTLFVIVGNYLAARRLFPELRFSPVTFFDKGIAINIFNFSWKVQISNITQLLIFQIDRILLSHYLGLGAVSNYEVASRTASQVRLFILSIFTPMIPAASSLHTSQGKDLVAGLYRRSFKYMASVAVPFSLMVIALAHPFIRTWLGPGYDTSAYTLQILTAAYFLNVLTGPGAFIMSGINKPEVNMKASMLAAVINVIGCLLLVRFVGYFGIILSIVLSITVSGVYFINTVCTNIPGIVWGIHKNALLKPFLIAVPLCTALWLFDFFFRIDGYPALSALSIVFLAIYGLVHLRGKYFDEFDHLTFNRLLPFGIKIR